MLAVMIRLITRQIPLTLKHTFIVDGQKIILTLRSKNNELIDSGIAQ